MSLLGAVALLLASAAGAFGQEGGAVAAGAQEYGNTCGRCHNPRSPLERADREWVTIMNHMRVRANLTGEQVGNILAFLQATNTDPRERVPLDGEAPAPTELALPAAGGLPPTDPFEIALGERLVQGKACLGCHVIKSQGGQVGPALDGVVRRRGADFVRRKLADPTVDNTASLMPNFGLSADEIEAMLAFLASLDGEGR